eukprot:8550-Heterococcus_DN1.PRE.2
MDMPQLVHGFAWRIERSGTSIARKQLEYNKAQVLSLHQRVLRSAFRMHVLKGSLQWVRKQVLTAKHLQSLSFSDKVSHAAVQRMKCRAQT